MRLITSNVLILGSFTHSCQLSTFHFCSPPILFHWITLPSLSLYLSLPLSTSLYLSLSTSLSTSLSITCTHSIFGIYRALNPLTFLSILKCQPYKRQLSPACVCVLCVPQMTMSLQDLDGTESSTTAHRSATPVQAWLGTFYMQCSLKYNTIATQLQYN